MNRTMIPKLTFSLALLFLVIGLVKPVYAVLLDIDTNDTLIDPDWTSASPNPYITDPAADQSAGGGRVDLRTAWVATGPVATNDYLFFRTAVTGTSAPTNSAPKAGVRIDCDNDQLDYELADPEDRYVVYEAFNDEVTIRQAVPGDPPFLTIILWSSGPGTPDGEFATLGNYEWRVLKSVLDANGCPNAATGSVRFGFVGILVDGVHDHSTPQLGPLWNTPTAVHLQNLAASPTSTSISILFLVTSGFLLFVSITLRRRNRQALAANKIQP